MRLISVKSKPRSHPQKKMFPSKEKELVIAHDFYQANVLFKNFDSNLFLEKESNNLLIPKCCHQIIKCSKGNTHIRTGMW